MDRVSNRMWLRLAIATGLAAATSGCAVSPFIVSGDYPVYDNPVNPTPASNYRVVCQTWPGIGGTIAATRIGHCTQVIAPVEQREVIRVRG